jgi:hypothetical protein
MVTRILALIGAFSVMPVWAYEVRDCFRYEEVQLTGTLVRQTYPGPPDYESVTKGDQPQVIWVLLLEQGMCVVDEYPSYPRVYREREIQLIVEPEQYQRYKRLLGKKVVALGELMPGGARYEKRLALRVTDMNRAAK